MLRPGRAARGTVPARCNGRPEHRTISRPEHGAAPGRLVPDRQRRSLGLSGRRRGAGARGLGRFLLGRPLRGVQRGILRVHRGDRIRDRGGAVRLVVRLRGAAARRLPADPIGGPGAMVAQGRGCGLATPGRTSVIGRRARRPSGRPCLMDRCAGLLLLGRQAPADRSRVGVRGQGRARRARSFPGATNASRAASIG